jgi:hypothetical protein
MLQNLFFISIFGNISTCITCFNLLPCHLKQLNDTAVIQLHIVVDVSIGVTLVLLWGLNDLSQLKSLSEFI